VRAGLSLLAQGGIDTVRVEPLAARLGVTKGSFYWHFKDRADLHTAMLEAWRQLGTIDIIDRVEAVRGSSAEQLRRLIELTSPNKKAVRLETAARAWATVDGKAARVLAEIDHKRLDYVAQLIVKNGSTPHEAKTKAKLLYLALIGSFFANSSSELELTPAVWRDFADTILL